MEKIEFDLLQPKDIEVKCSEVKEEGFVALLYKNARTDQKALDDKFGIAGWCDNYKEINGVLYCGVSIKFDNEWITKWDCGIESRADEKGNEKKGEASDAFKRACFKWGHGRELYTAPFIYIKAKTKVKKKDANGNPIYALADKYETYHVSEITYTEDRAIKTLKIVNSKGVEVYSSNKPKKPTTKVASSKNEQKTTTTTTKSTTKTKYTIINDMIKDSKITMSQVNERIKKKYQKNIRVNDLNEEQFKELTDALQKALEGNGNE
jgi:hypothetical protein